MEDFRCVFLQQSTVLGLTGQFGQSALTNAQMASTLGQDKLNPPLCTMGHVKEQIKKPDLATI